MSDLRLAFRALIKRPAFSALIIVTLAIGIGANSAIFSVVNGVLLRPLPYANPERLVMAWTSLPAFGREVTSLPDYRDWREQATSFASLAALANASYGLSGDGDREPERVAAAEVSANFFSTLGVSARLGRTFSAAEESGDVRRMVISHELWQRRFGGRSDVIGQTIGVAGNPWEIIGVLPPDFRFGEPIEVFAPLDVHDTIPNRRGDFLHVVGRLAPGVDIAAADAELKAIAQRLAELYPQTNAEVSADLVPLREQLVGDVRPALALFMGAVGLVLLIASANVANLLLARGTGRQREMAVRVALGASRGALVRQLLVESLVLAASGAALGLLVASWIISLLQGASLDALPRFHEVTIDWRVVMFTAGLSVVVGVLFGLVPALRISRTAFTGAMRDGARTVRGGSAFRDPQRLLVLAEVSLAVVLLTGAGLLLRSFNRLQGVESGVRAENVLHAFFAPPSSRYPEAEQVRQFLHRLVEESARLPNVSGAALTTLVPASGDANYNAFGIDGRADPPPNVSQDAQRYVVSHDYHSLLGIPILAGRGFTEQDRLGTQDVAIVSQSAARRYWPDATPIGQRISFDGTRFFTIIGIAADTRQEGLDQAPYPQVYVPVAQAPLRGVHLLLRTRSDPSLVVPELRRLMRSLDGDVALSDVRPMTEMIADTIARPRINAAVLGVFAALAVLLAALGIYGVTSYAVVQRTREIGVRMALGAQRPDVLQLVVRQGMLPVLAGLVLGVIAALAATRVMGRLLYEIAPTDPLTFAAIPLILGAVALTASVLPALRATRVDPVEALRTEG